MPKYWTIPLPDGFRIEVRKDTAFGYWIGCAVVLVHEEECVTRYDSAHGVPHRNILGRRKGLLRKEWHESLSLKEAFEHAIRDLSLRYAEYYRFYAER